MDFSRTGFNLSSLSESGQHVVLHLSGCSNCHDRVDQALKVLPMLQNQRLTWFNPAKSIEFAESLQKMMFPQNHPLQRQNLEDFLRSLKSTLDHQNLSQLRVLQNSTEVDQLFGDDNFGIDECSICLGEFESSDLVRKTSCGHGFHTHCINQWLKDKNSCPLCRSTLKISLPFCRASST